MITNEQLYFYNSLEVIQQEILKITAFIGNNISAMDLDYFAKVLEINLSTHESRKLIKSAAENNILHINQRNYYTYIIDIDFLIYIIPRSTGIKKYLSKMNLNYSHRYESFRKSLVDCFYTLVFENQDEYTKYEWLFLNNHKTTSYDTFSSVYMMCLTILFCTRLILRFSTA